MFLQQAEELYLANPLKTRYTTKYRHCDGKLILKVTDDVTVRRERSLSEGAVGQARVGDGEGRHLRQTRWERREVEKTAKKKCGRTFGSEAGDLLLVSPSA